MGQHVEKLTEQEMERMRDVSIHMILGVPNTYKTKMISCPFEDHNDNTASFALYPENNYHCYGMCQGTVKMPSTLWSTCMKQEDVVNQTLSLKHLRI